MISGDSQPPRRRRRDGEHSRAVILAEAARLATVDGIGGLTIGRLADAAGMSKSGLFTLFGSKEELQLATIEAASVVFDEEVVDRAAGSEPGLARLTALADAYLEHVESGTFPGGCFFASTMTEVAMQPGAVRDRLVGFLDGWVGLLQAAVRDAAAAQEIGPGEDPAQLAFEVQSALYLANLHFVVSREHQAIEHARRAIRDRLARAAAPVRTAGRPRTARTVRR